MFSLAFPRFMSIITELTLCQRPVIRHECTFSAESRGGVTSQSEIWKYLCEFWFEHTLNVEM